MRPVLTGGPNDLLLLDDYKEERDKHKKLVDASNDNKGKAYIITLQHCHPETLKKLKTLEFPLVTYEKPFYEDQKKIRQNSLGEAYFKEVREDGSSVIGVVSLNENLSKLITFGYVFENNDFGLEKLSTNYVTYQLKSVSYE